MNSLSCSQENININEFYNNDLPYESLIENCEHDVNSAKTLFWANSGLFNRFHDLMIFI